MLSEQIKADLVLAMKAGEALRVSVLRMLLSELNYKQIDLGRLLEEADVQGVIAKEVKKRREAIDSFTAGGRMEQAQSEKQELEILQAYLPQMLSETEIAAEVEQLLGEMKEEERTNFGQVMRVVSPKFKGRAEGAMVAQVVKVKLGQ